MKKFYCFIIVIFGLIFISGLNAQEVLNVTPGYGTLNEAINQYGGSKIYQLQSGQWYGLSEIIENVDYHLQIIGGEYDEQTMPATLQTGTAGDGVVFARMISAKGDVTLKNLYIMNVDIDGQVPNLMMQSDKLGGRVIIDNCIFDPMGMNDGIRLYGGEAKFYFTNNKVVKQGNRATQNDTALFRITSSDEGVIGFDTLWIENNTFVSTGMVFIRAEFAARFHNFCLINHNSFFFHKSQLDWVNFENEYYFTNNLLFEFMTNPYNHAWQPQPGADPAHPKPALIYADTLPGETLPSERIQYLQYNWFHKTQKFYDLIAEANTLEETIKVNMQPFFWKKNMSSKWGQIDPVAAFNMSREAQLFNYDGPDGTNVNEDFPLWKEGNTTYDIDPLYNDPLIYEYSTRLRDWQYYSVRVNLFKYPAANYPPVSEWANWHWDLDGNIAVNDAWPVFDGTYSNPEVLTGSIEGLPLGDLNWYPEKKALWAAERDQIFAHMKSGNTERYTLQGSVDVRPIVTNVLKYSRVFPNPLSNESRIEFVLDKFADVEVSVYNVLGRRVQILLNEGRTAGTHTITLNTIDLPKGVYFCIIKADSNVETHRLLVIK